LEFVFYYSLLGNRKSSTKLDQDMCILAYPQVYGMGSISLCFFRGHMFIGNRKYKINYKE